MGKRRPEGKGRGSPCLWPVIRVKIPLLSIGFVV